MAQVQQTPWNPLIVRQSSATHFGVAMSNLPRILALGQLHHHTDVTAHKSGFECRVYHGVEVGEVVLVRGVVAVPQAEPLTHYLLTIHVCDLPLHL